MWLSLKLRQRRCSTQPRVSASGFGHKARRGRASVCWSLAAFPIVVGLRYNSFAQLVTRLHLGQLCIGGRLPPPSRPLCLLSPLVNATLGLSSRQIRPPTLPPDAPSHCRSFRPTRTDTAPTAGTAQTAMGPMRFCSSGSLSKFVCSPECVLNTRVSRVPPRQWRSM